MQTVLRLRFPGRRYHATPWGHHVNEGQVEWPPSPWRILRALLATGFTKLRWPAEAAPPEAQRLLARLAPLRPSYVLPPASLAHTRHYVDAAGKKPLIFDTWARLEDPIEVVWDVTLPEDEWTLLEALARHLGYLGRAESWVEAEVADRALGTPNAHPDRGGPPGPGWESVRVLSAMAPQAYDDWRATQVHPIVEANALPTGKRPTAAQKKKLEKALAPYPRDLLDALCVDTGVMQGHGWSTAPGTQHVLYWRRAGALAVAVPTMPRRDPQAEVVPLALLSMSTESGGTSALPPRERVFAQGRLLHRALASVVNKQFDGARRSDLALRLLGRDDEGPAKTHHKHAHLLHLDLGETDRLDHALIYAPMGLHASAQDALRRLRATYMKGGAGELKVTLAGLGHARDLRRMLPPHGRTLTRTLGPEGGARRWQTATPYVAPRLLKKRGKDSLESQVRHECAQRGLPELAEIRELERARVIALRHYILHDSKHHPPFVARHALELVFTTPAEGPICLGYGAHVGLGRFEAQLEGE